MNLNKCICHAIKLRISLYSLLVYSFDGIVVFGLLFICTCAYLKKVPRLNSWLLSEKKGVWGVFYKGERFFFCILTREDMVCNFHMGEEQSRWCRVTVGGSGEEMRREDKIHARVKCDHTGGGKRKYIKYCFSTVTWRKRTTQDDECWRSNLVSDLSVVHL